MRAWARLEVQPDSSGDAEEVFRVLAPLSCFKIPLVHTSHQPSSKALAHGIQLLWSTLSDGGNHWEQMLWLGPCPDELTFPNASGITNDGALWRYNLIIFTLSLTALLLGAGRIIWGWLSPFNWQNFSLTQLDIFFFFS